MILVTLVCKQLKEKYHAMIEGSVRLIQVVLPYNLEKYIL